MKKVEAIIRTSKFEAVVEALSAIGVAFLTFSEVKGIGTEAGPTQQYRGTSYDAGFIPRTLMQIVVPNSKLETVVDTVLKAAYTGHVGDGKIFISEIADAYRIRNKDKGENAL